MQNDIIPVKLAAQYGHAEVVKTLVEVYGANPNHASKVIVALRSNGPLNVVEGSCLCNTSLVKPPCMPPVIETELM